MQPFTAELAQADLDIQKEAILIGDIAYRAVLDDMRAQFEHERKGARGSSTTHSSRGVHR